MPGRNRRKIVSQQQRKYLHAAAGRGEISEQKVHDMEMRSKSKLPKRHRGKRKSKNR